MCYNDRCSVTRNPRSILFLRRCSAGGRRKRERTNRNANDFLFCYETINRPRSRSQQKTRVGSVWSCTFRLGYDENVDSMGLMGSTNRTVDGRSTVIIIHANVFPFFPRSSRMMLVLINGFPFFKTRLLTIQLGTMTLGRKFWNALHVRMLRKPWTRNDAQKNNIYSCVLSGHNVVQWSIYDFFQIKGEESFTHLLISKIFTYFKF